jgi:thiamine-phosphate pyrophosphorylase
VINGAHAAGVRCFQLREKEGSDRERVARLEAMLRTIRELGHGTEGGSSLVIVNDRVDFALTLQADGLHLGQDDLGIAEARRIAGPRLLIGKSARNEAELRGAMVAGADYLGAGSMFQTITKQKVILNGPEWGGLATEIAAPLPVFCIGGIDPANLAALTAAFPAGVQPRIAVSSAVCQARNPEEVCMNMLRALSE